MSEYIHKSHNVSVLMYHYVCPAKYRRVVFSEAVDKSLKEICLEISKRYEIDFIEIGTDKDHVNFFDTKYSHGEPDPNNPGCKEYHSIGDIEAPPGSKTKTLGWGILDKGILCEYGGQRWGRKYNSAICQIPGNRERIQKAS